MAAYMWNLIEPYKNRWFLVNFMQMFHVVINALNIFGAIKLFSYNIRQMSITWEKTIGLKN
jgi:hypothetical protein